MASRPRLSTARKFDRDPVSIPCLSFIGAHTQHIRLQRHFYLVESRDCSLRGFVFPGPYDPLYIGPCTGHRLSIASRVCDQFVERAFILVSVVASLFNARLFHDFVPVYSESAFKSLYRNLRLYFVFPSGGSTMIPHTPLSPTVGFCSGDGAP